MNESNNAHNTRKVAIVTGSSRGLGRNTVLALAREGVDSIVTYRSSRAEAEAVVAEIASLGGKAVALRLDTGDVGSFEAFASEVRQVLSENWGRQTFDYLVNNAGHGAYADLASTTEELFDGLVNVHFKGVYFLTQKLVPLMADGGRILNVSSGLTRFSFAGYAAYAAMKGAVEVLTRYWALELGPRGIAVNTIAPGAIATDFGGGHVRDDAQLQSILASRTALGRVGEADDIGPLIASVLSESHRWVNGQRIEASGGIAL